MHLKMSSAKWRPFRLGLNVLRAQLIRYTGRHLSMRSITGDFLLRDIILAVAPFTNMV